MAHEQHNANQEPESEEDVRHYRDIGDFVAGTLGTDSDMSDEEWERLFNLGMDYYYYQGHPLPQTDGES